MDNGLGQKKNNRTDTFSFGQGNINVVQGISFTKNDLKFNGSKIDMQFSYSKIKYRLDENRSQEYFAVIDTPSLDQAFCRLVKEGLLQAEKDEERAT